jgi:hypothetical protein
MLTVILPPFLKSQTVRPLGSGKDGRGLEIVIARDSRLLLAELRRFSRGAFDTITPSSDDSTP